MVHHSPYETGQVEPGRRWMSLSLFYSRWLFRAWMQAAMLPRWSWNSLQNHSSACLAVVTGFGRVCSFHGFLSIRALFTAFTAAQLTVDMSQEGFFFFCGAEAACSLIQTQSGFGWASLTLDFRVCACARVCGILGFSWCSRCWEGLCFFFSQFNVTGDQN